MRLPAEMTAAQIAHMIGGKVHGSPETKVSSVALSPLDAVEGQIAFMYDAKLLKRLDQCKATLVIVPEGTKADRPLILVQRPNLAIQKILTALQPKRYTPAKGVHPTAVVDPSAELGEDVAIGPLVVVGPKTKIGARTVLMAGTVIGGEVQIGSDCVFHAGCLIADYIKIGNKVTMQQGASIGPDGFGYVTERPSNMELRMAGINDLSDDPNPLLKIPQIGTVVIEDEVEIGSNATIDRATMGATVIGKGSKIDNLVMIAHNVRIGREVLVVSQSGVAGSCTIGDRAILAGHTAVSDHLHVGKDAIIEGKAGVMKDVPDGDVMCGVPAQQAKPYFTEVALKRKLPKIFDDVRDMKKRIQELEAKLLDRELVKN